jgi:hypothetical protein
MKNLPKEFILTNFDVKEGNEVLQYHGFGDTLGCRWVYIVVTKPFDYIDSESYLTHYSHLPRLSYQQWKEIGSPNVQESFPERWYIVLTSENRDILNKWRHDKCSSFKEPFFNPENDSRLYSHDVIGDGTYFDITPLREIFGFVEITFEQFKKFVLKEDTVEIYAHTIDIIQLRELYNNANKDGKEFLEKLFKGCDVFWELFYLNNVDIDFLRENCNKEVVTKIFGEVIDFDIIEVGDYVTMKDGTVGNVVIYNNNWTINDYKDFAKREDKKVTTVFVAKDGSYKRYGQDYFQTQLKSFSKK